MRRLIEPAVTPGSHDFVSDAQYDEIVKVHLPRLRAMDRDYFARSGYEASFVALTADPSMDVNNSKSVHGYVKQGVLLQARAARP